MKRMIISVMILSLLMLFQLPIQSNAESIVSATVLPEWLTVHNGASYKDKDIDWLKHGTQVTVEKKVGSYALITYKGHQGYVLRRYLDIHKQNADTQASSAANSSVYIVKSGDSLSRIAQHAHMTVAQLKALNHLTGDMIRIGQKLNVGEGASASPIVHASSNAPASPAYTLYKVQPGDSLSTIAYHYHISVQKLKNTNSLSSDTIYIGQKLKISGSDGKVHTQAYEPLKGKTIILSPGHGGKDTGAAGNGVVEKKITLQISKKIKTDLQAQGAKVIMARTGDYYVTLSYRAHLAAKDHGDIFVAVHVNKFPDPSIHGTTTYFNNTKYKGSTNPNPTKSAELAKDILSGIVSKAGMASRGARSANYVVLRENSVPSALIETAYLSNKYEAGILKSNTWQNKVAEGVTKGIDKYFSSLKK